jgi:hypothetical protein
LRVAVHGTSDHHHTVLPPISAGLACPLLIFSPFTEVGTLAQESFDYTQQQPNKYNNQTTPT